MRVYFHSKEVVETLNRLGLPLANKNNIRIPDVIKENKNLAIIGSFLRGLGDTDFSVYVKKGPYRKRYSYPIITTTFSNEPLCNEIVNLLELSKSKPT